MIHSQIREVLRLQVCFFFIVLLGVPFSNGEYSIASDQDNRTFRFITSSSITSDSASSHLKDCILNKRCL